jgi:hypothetical protein
MVNHPARLCRLASPRTLFFRGQALGSFINPNPFFIRRGFSPAIYLPKRTLLFSSFEKEKSAFQKARFLKRWKNIWTFEGLFVILQREYKGNRE